MNAAERLRVLHVAPTPFFSDRGCHIRIEGIVRALSRKKIKSVVCTYHHGRERPGVDTRRIQPIKFYEDTKAGPHSAKYYADCKLLWLVQKTMRSYRPDIIHAHLHEGALLGWLAKWFTLNMRIPLVVDIQGGLVGELDSHDYFARAKMLRPAFRGLEYMILRLPQHLFCSSVSSMTMLQADYGLRADRLTLLIDRIEPNMENDTAHRVGNGKVTVVYSGSLLAAKGLPMLLEVAARLLTRRSDVQMMLIGYPLEETESFLRARGLSDRCTLTGKINFEVLPQHLGRADIALDPKSAAAGEGSGKTLNYMAAGLPVVAFDSANNRAVLGQQEELVAQGSIDGFVRRIEFLIDHPQVRRAEGRRNRERAQRELTWDTAMDMVLPVYAKLLGPEKYSVD